MTLQRIITIFGSALLASTLVSVPRAQANGDVAELPPENMRALESTVYFGSDSAELDQQAKQKLDETVTWLRENPNRVVVVAGHTDEVGQEDYNLVLGKKRARQTKQYLVEQGIDPARILSVSFGEDFPASEQPAENRRVVFYATRSQQMGGEQQQPGTYGEQQMADQGQQQATDADAEILGVEPMEVVEEADEVVEEAGGVLSRYGLSVAAGGGVMGFLGGTIRDYTAPGGTWDVRVTFGTRKRLAGEVMYYGVAQGIDALGLDDDATLVGHGLDGALRLNVLGRGDLQPYILGGLGWTHYGLRNAETNISNVQSSDNLLHVPLAVGTAYYFGNFLVDVRGTVRTAFGEDLLRAEPEGPEVSSDLSTWAVTARVGWEF